MAKQESEGKLSDPGLVSTALPAEEAHSSSEQLRSRRPYTAPSLRHLGSVRDLTLGNSHAKPDAGGLGHQHKTM
jgi:hypothetical protein